MILKYISAIGTRVAFMILSLVGIDRVAKVKNDDLYWCLIFLFVPLMAEMFYNLKVRKGKDCRRFSPAILLFLITFLPSIWVLEVHHQQNRNSPNEPKCIKFHSLEDLKNLINSNGSHYNQSGAGVEMPVCPDIWILGLHIALLFLLIVGKWFLPRGSGMSSDELYQLLLIFVGTAADILEFSNETLSDVQGNSPELVYIILGVWSMSMLQFPLHLAVVRPNESDVDGGDDSLISKRFTDLWSIAESMVIMDGPFFLVRMVVIFHYGHFHMMLVFFTVKNFLVVSLNACRLYWICRDHRESCTY